MARFRFRLQPVLEVRERLQDDRQRELALKQQELSEAQTQLEALNADRDSRRADLARDHTGLSVDTLRATYAHLAYLDRAIDDQAVRVAACVDEVERAQVRLVAANTDRKVLETLRTRRFEAFNSDAALVEQREADDQNARRFGRTRSEQGKTDER